MRTRGSAGSEKGFTLIETMIALVVLAVGVLGLCAMLANALSYMQASQYDFIAQQKAEEAMEAIFTAKYNGNAQWAQISNYNATANPQGLFLSGAQPLLQPGSDGLVGTEADSTTSPDYILYPGPDMKLGTADDVKMPLTNFTRTITITGVAGEAYLREISIVVAYTEGQYNRSYTLNSEISAF